MIAIEYLEQKVGSTGEEDGPPGKTAPYVLDL
jgi:hypothetical protein